MRRIEKLKKLKLIDNILWGISGEVFVRFVKFFQFIVIAQFLGVDGLGTYSYALAAAATLSIFFDFGILVVATKNNSSSSSPADLLPYLVLKICTSLTGIVVLYFALQSGFLVAGPDGVLMLIVISILILDFANLILARYRAEQNFQKEAQFRVVVITLQTAVTIVSLFIAADLKQLAYCLIVVNVLSMFPVIAILWSAVGITDFSSFCLRVKGIFWQCIPIAGISLFGALYTSVDVLVLGFYADITTVGIYTVAMKFILGLIIIPVVFIQNAQIPNLAELNNQTGLHDKQVTNNWRKTYFTTLFFGLFMCLFFAVFSEFIVMLTFGSEFESSAKLLSVLTMVGLFYYIYTPFLTILIVSDNARYAFLTQFLCMLINITMLFLLIPRYGVSGAVVASMATHFLICIIIVPISLSINKKLFSLNDVVLIISSTMLYILAVWLMYYSHEFFQGYEIIFKLSVSLIFVVLFRKRFINLVTEIMRFINSKMATSS